MEDPQLAETTQAIHKLSHELANFIALFEQSEVKFEQRQHAIEQNVIAFENRMAEHLDHMNQSLVELSEVMTSAGAARWRVAAETALKEGNVHVQRIQELTENFEKLGTDKFERLDKLTLESEKRFAKALNLLAAGHQDSVNEFRNRITKAYSEVEAASEKALADFQRAKKWGRLERIMIVVLVSLITSCFTGMYLNGEWPWESHQRAVQERQLGQYVITHSPNTNQTSGVSNPS